ncbi:MAG TPA: cation:proton antiporter [Saprospiraceae bacterium]|nr:cation:proton antiporter [Saprospiraceae bacterium]
MDIFNTYNLIIEACVIIILSFFFSEIAKKTNVPSVLLLIALGMILKVVMESFGISNFDFKQILEVLGTIGLIMIVLEAALELELKPEKLMPIGVSFAVALIGLLVSTATVAWILMYYFPAFTLHKAWLYATPLSILSSAIIIPSVGSLVAKKKEFHVYESTFSDIIGIMLFYFLAAKYESGNHLTMAGYSLNILITIVLSLVLSYGILLVFQNIKSSVKLFLLISVLILIYAIGKKMHLSSLIIILIFGLMIANVGLFFRGELAKWLKVEKAKDIYDGLHVITLETAFVVRTFFFVIFGITISLSALTNLYVVGIAALILLSIYVIRLILLRAFIGDNVVPQVFIAPRGLITVLLFYQIPVEGQLAGFEPGILMLIIIGSSLIMTGGMIFDHQRSNRTINKVKSDSVETTEWKAPSYDD